MSVRQKHRSPPPAPVAQGTPRHTSVHTVPGPDTIDWQVLICLLGRFRILRAGQLVAIPAGGKIEALLRVLGLSPEHASTRDVLLEALWPNRPPSRAGQSLNSLVHVLNKSLCAALRGAAPVLHAGTLYRLNTQAGVGVDFVLFERLAREGDEHAQQGRIADAVGAYRAAVRLYEGDLCVGTDLESVIERERLRAIYLTLLARLAEHEYCDRDAAAALHYALRLLNADPCREDAHRMAMRCYVRLGQRAQALRQFRLCEDFLHAEFDAAPESATVALFEQIRLHPDDTQSR